MSVLRAVIRPAVLAGLAVACLLTLAPAAYAANQVRISQVYGGGGGSSGTYKRDYVELFNSGATPVSLAGWSLQYGSASGSIAATSINMYPFPAITIQPHAYLLVQCGAQGSGGAEITPTPDLSTPTTGMSMSNSSGKIALVSNLSFPTSCMSASILDLVGYGTANCFEGGAAVDPLATTLAAFRNLNGCQDTDENSDDFTVAPPAPRNSASPTYSCSTAEPTTQPSGLSFSSDVGSAMTVGWSANGDGSNRLVLVKAGSAVTGAPVDGATYTASATYGGGTPVGDAYVAYNGSGMSAPLAGLTPGVTYYVSIFEFNGSNGTEDYLTSGPLTGSHPTAVGCPTVTLSPGSLPAATAGTFYSQAITATGGTSPYGYAVTSGALPDGLSLATDGTLSGTPTASGDFPVTVTATDAHGCTGGLAYSLHVAPAAEGLCPGTTPNVNGAWLWTRVWNECPSSDLTVTNNYPSQIQIGDLISCPSGWANLHIWDVSADGGASRAQLQNCSQYVFAADFTLTGDGDGEAGLRLSPWWSPDVDGRFMVNASNGQVAAFGGVIPFYQFYEISYTRGEPIHLEMVYLPHSLTSSDPGTMTYNVRYQGSDYTSGPLAFGPVPPAEAPLHGDYGELWPAHLGGYLQALMTAGEPAGLTATWSNVLFSTLPAASAVTMTSSPNPSTQYSLVTLTATVSPGAATGTVSFYDGGTLLGGAALAGGVATLAVSTLTSGAHSLHASYAGDGLYGACVSSDYVHTVLLSTYTWQGGGSGAWGTAANWSPARTAPASTDVLQFNGGGAVTVTAVPTQTIGRLLVAGGTNVDLQAATGDATLTISGGVGALAVPGGCALNLGGSNALIIALPSGTTGSVGGSVGVSGAAHRLTALGSNAISFESGSRFATGAGFSGNPFGNGTGTSGASSVRFASGSTFIQAYGANPFVLAAPASVTTFEHGSVYSFRPPAPNVLFPSLYGRTYGDFQVWAGSTVTSTQGFSGALPCTMDRLEIQPGGQLTLVAASGSPNGVFQIKGDVVVDGTLFFSPAENYTLSLMGSTPQTVSGAGTITLPANLAGVRLDNASGLTLARDLTIGCGLTLLNGKVTTGTHTLTVNGTVAGGTEDRYVVGRLRKLVATTGGAAAADFPVGDATGYAPVSTLFPGTITTDGYLAVQTFAGDHPELGGSGLSTGHGVNRYWRVVSEGLVFADCDVTFGFPAADLDPDTDPLRLFAGKLDGGTWTYPAVVARTATSTQVSGVSSFSDFALGLHGSLAGTYTVGTGGTYATLTAAVADVGASGVSAPVTLSLTDASYPSETFPIVVPGIAGASATNTVTIKPAPGVTATLAGNSSSCVLELNGADHVIVDGSNTPGGTTRDLTIQNTSVATATAAICLFSTGADGASHDVVKNVNLACGADQTLAEPPETFGVVSSGGEVSTASDGVGNDANTLANMQVTQARWGIYLRGAEATPGTDNAVTGCLVGPASFGSEQIGRGGIVLENQVGATVTDNEVRFAGVAYLPPIQGAAATQVVGIALGGTTWYPAPTPTVLSGAVVERNRVHDLAEDRANGSAVGILLAAAGAATGNRIANNVVYSVRACAPNPQTASGIALCAGDGDRVVFNSVSLTGDLDPDPSTTGNKYAIGLRVLSGEVQNLVLEDNVFSVDVRTNSGAGRCASILLPDPYDGSWDPPFAWGTGGSNHNAYCHGTGNPECIVGFAKEAAGGIVQFLELPDWQAQFPGQDLASVSGEPRFVAAAGDLHVSTGGLVSVLANAGAPVTGVTADLDGQPRSVATPDIGADEFAPAVANDVAAGWAVFPSPGATVPAGSFDPIGRFFNLGSAAQAGVTVRCRILDGGGAVYDETAAVATWPAETGTDVTFPSASLAAGAYTLELSATLSGDAVPANDVVTSGFTFSAPLAGEYHVGAAGDFATLTAAIAALAGAGVSGPVSFLLTDATYSSGETFPITVRPFAGASATNTVTVRPDAGVTAAISGTAPSALIRVLGADYFVLDGSNLPGGATRDLTLSVTGVASAVAAITLEATFEGDGATHDVIRNCVVRGSGANVQSGVFTGSLYGAGDSPSLRARERPPVPDRAKLPTAFAGVLDPLNDPEPDGALSPQVVQLYAAAAPNADNRIENNDVAGVRTALLFSGNSWSYETQWHPGDARNTVVANLLGVPLPGASMTAGASFTWQQDLSFDRNDVQNATSTGLQLTDCAAAMVTRNRIHGSVSTSSGVVGIMTSDLNLAVAANVFANNFVYDLRSTHAAPDVSGIYSLADPGGDRFLDNTIYLGGQLTGGAGTVQAFSSYYDDPTAELEGNVLLVDGTAPGAATFYARRAMIGPMTAPSDHNDLFVRAGGSASAVLAMVGGTTCGTLAEWQAATGQDPHSISADPLLLSVTDPHVDNGAGRPVSPLANAGTPDAAVTVDFDGDPRSPTAPDIGADEFATYTLATSATHGSIARDAPGPLYNPGTVVTLSAVPDEGYAFYEWGGDASGRVNPLALALDRDRSVTALFDAAHTLVALGPPASCVSTAHPCAVVPCTIARTDALPIRGFRVGVRLSTNLALCDPGITEGTYLGGSAPGAVTTFQVTDQGGGSYRVEGSLTGEPCGATASSGTLFDVHVRRATGAADGAGVVSPDLIVVVDCDLIGIPAGAGASAAVPLDAVPPARLLTLAAAQRTTGNGSSGTTAIRLSWAGASTDTMTVYRAPYGHYPEYDDLGGGVPALPSFPPPAPWTLAGSVVGGTQWTDETPGGRDVWYYVAFLRDACGNVSVASNRTAGTLSYHLGDVHDGAVDCQGNNQVDAEDVSFFGAHYGDELSGPGDPLACLDVGPTVDRHVDTRPATDDWLDFEDLMVFAVNFEAVAAPQAAATPVSADEDALAIDAPVRVEAGQEFAVRLHLSGSGRLGGLSLQLAWDAAVCEPVGVRPGALLPVGRGLVLSPAPGGVDAVALGRGNGLVGEGELATVIFRARESGNPAIAAASLRARDRENQEALLGVTVGLVPSATALAQAAPNPFVRSTLLRFALARGGPVELCVYSVDGRRVGRVVSAVLPPGTYAYEWNAARLRPGLYYARLSTPDGRFTRTLVLMK
jgi:hypothetical protein